MPPNLKEKQVNVVNDVVTETVSPKGREKDKINSEKANKEKWAKEADDKAVERTEGAIKKEINKKDLQPKT